MASRKRTSGLITSGIFDKGDASSNWELCLCEDLRRQQDILGSLGPLEGQVFVSWNELFA